MFFLFGSEIMSNSIWGFHARLCSLFLLLAIAQAPAQASPLLSRLEDLLNATPDGGWVKASTNLFSDAWATGSAAVNYSSFQNPGSVVMAWSSVAWDSSRGDLLLWGGGHANYAGNEMYVWSGGSGEWGRGSLSSRVDSNYFVVDNAAPQSSHTYDNNIYLPINDMFLTFGGAAFQSGGGFTTLNPTTGAASPAGPWLWDPSRADPNKVGGTTGSGYDPTSVGGEMWTNMWGRTVGSPPPSFVNGAAAYHTENGMDVVYVTADSQSSGFPSLYRYTLGDLRNGGSATWEKVGVMSTSAAFAGAGTIDSKHNLFIRTSQNTGSYTAELAIWDLTKSNPQNPGGNQSIAIQLIREDGTPFPITGAFGIEYDAANDQILLWDGSDKGTVWSVKIAYDANGKIVTTLTAKKLTSSTVAQPSGNFYTGVFGKWDYVDELGAFIAVNEFSSAIGDAEVWLYKPFSNQVDNGGGTGTVPEPGSLALACIALALMRRKLRQYS